VGEGDPGRQHQAGVIRAIPAKYSVTPVPRIEVWGRLSGIAVQVGPTATVTNLAEIRKDRLHVLTDM